MKFADHFGFAAWLDVGADVGNARLGGDEFAIIQLAVERTEDSELLAKRIITAFSAPFDIDGHQIVVGTSVGIALAPGDGITAEELLKSGSVVIGDNIKFPGAPEFLHSVTSSSAYVTTVHDTVLEYQSGEKPQADAVTVSVKL